MKRSRWLLVVVAVVLSAGSLEAQQEPAERAAPLEEFVQRVARLWSAGEVTELVDLIPPEGRVMLDTGAGIEPANARHATAALRALFGQRETVSATPARVTVASSEPVSGFGEISWTYRARGAPGEESQSIYVGALWEGRSWRLTELRLMP